jgi:hypothetical protein
MSIVTSADWKTSAADVRLTWGDVNRDAGGLEHEWGGRAIDMSDVNRDVAGREHECGGRAIRHEAMSIVARCSQARKATACGLFRLAAIDSSNDLRVPIRGEEDRRDVRSEEPGRRTIDLRAAGANPAWVVSSAVKSASDAAGCFTPKPSGSRKR